MKILILSLSALLALASCTSDDDQSPNPDLNLTKEIRLNDLHVGQSTRFLIFDTSCPLNGPFDYTSDTLLVEVIALNEGLGFRETYTPGSPILDFIEIIPVEYEVIPESGNLLMPNRLNSQLFFFFGNDTLPVQKANSINLQQGSCFLEYMNGEPFIGEEVGRISPLNVGNFQYFDKRVVSCVPPFLDLDAYLVFDHKQLSLSMTIMDAGDIFHVRGFAAIPND